MSASASRDHAPLAPVARLVQLLRIEKEGLYVVIAYAVGIGLASLAAPIGVQMLVNAIAFSGLYQPILVLSILVLVALVFAAALQAAQVWIVERIQQRLFVRVAADLADRLPRTAVSSFDEYHGPELVNRFFDVLTLQKGAAMLLLDGVLVTLQVLVGGTLLTLYHPALLAFGAVVLAVILGILFGLGSRGAETSLEESESKYALVAWFEEIARHPTIFRSHGGDRFAAERSTELMKSYVATRRAHFRIVFRQTIAFLALQAIATAALLAIGGALVLQGKLTLGQLVAAELILSAVVAGFAKFGKYLEMYYDLVAAMDKLGKLADLPLERDDGELLKQEQQPLAVRFIAVEFTHPGRRSESLEPVTTSIPAGAQVAVVGPNGSGKSTLIDLLFGLRDPTRGHIEVNGLPLRDLSLKRLRENIALVRGAAIFEGSVMENICMGREGIRLEDVRMALEAVDMWDEITSLPDGLSTHVTTGAGNFSAGQAQRLAIARAIVVRPRCLLLDEALDHLDPQSCATVLGRVLRRDAPWTTIVATHDPSVADVCSHRFDIERGQLTTSVVP